VNAASPTPLRRALSFAVVALVGFVWAATASAAASVPQRAPTSPLNAGRLLEMVLGLGVVLALIVLAAWLVRRVLRLQPSMNGQMQILGALSLGTRERVVLLQIGGRQLLLGVAPGRIQTLHLLDEPLPLAAQPDGKRAPFQHQVHAALRGLRSTAPKP